MKRAYFGLSFLGLVAACGGSTTVQPGAGGACVAAGTGGTGGTGGAGGSPAGQVCQEVTVTSWSCPPDNYVEPLVSFVKSSGFIFRGTVTALHAVTPGLIWDDTSRTVIVHVTQVLEQGDVIDLAGQDVTVQLLAAPTMAVGVGSPGTELEFAL